MDIEEIHRGASAMLIGQTIEWLIWSAITSRSRGALHVYLPYRDMGVDGIVRDRGTGRNLPVQVKGRTKLDEGILRVHVQSGEANVPGSVLLLALAESAHAEITEPLFVIPMDEVRDLAPRVKLESRDVYSVEIPYPPGGRTHWHRFATSLNDLGSRLFPDAKPSEGIEQEFGATETQLNVTGYFGETALIHHLSQSTVVSLFHAAPDMEFVEYVALRVDTGRSIGIQVKCTELAENVQAGSVQVGAATLPVSDDLLVIFGRDPSAPEPVLHHHCMVLRADEVTRVGEFRGDRYDIAVDLASGGTLSPSLIEVNHLRAHIESLLA